MRELALADIAGLITRHKKLLESIKTIEYAIGTPSGIRYDKVNVQTTPTNRLEEGVVRLETLIEKAQIIEAQIAAKVALFEKMQKETGKYSNDEWMVLQLRYFRNMNYAMIEEATGFSHRKIRRVMGRIKEKDKNNH